VRDFVPKAAGKGAEGARKRLWCEHAWLGGEHAEAGVAVEIEGERIASVTAGAEPAPDAERLAGLTLPGLANAHSHAFHRALRGRTQAERGSFWTWREQMYALAETLDPDSYLPLARATFAEMALAGITAVGEFHYLHHGPGGEAYADPNEMGLALTEAARQAGIRITLIDACYLHGGIGKELDEVQQRFADADGGAWTERVATLDPGAGARAGAAIHSVRAVDPDSAATVAAFASERGQPLHAHVSEQPAENAACVDAYHRTPSEVLLEAGALRDSFTAVHATHLTESDIELLGRARCTCCLCPTTERDLADGIGPARRLADAGARLALGSDSHAVIDHFEEARAVELDERLDSGERGRHGAATLLEAATAAGHASIGWPEAGRIEPGAPADLVTVGLGSVRLAGTAPESILDAVVFAATAGDVTDVLVDGRPVVSNGAHTAIEVAAELDAAITSLWR
jgi:formiminoglutamate deiminase